jgi:hypothetical protein
VRLLLFRKQLLSLPKVCKFNFTNKNKQNLLNYELFFVQFISRKEGSDEFVGYGTRTLPPVPHVNEPRGID